MNTQGRPVSDKRFVLAFYGIDPSPKASAGLFQTCIDWFMELGYPPDKMGIGGTGYSGKVGDFQRGSSKLQKTGFTGVDDFCIYASKPNGLVPGMEYFVSASYSRPGEDGGYAVVAVPSTLAPKAVWWSIARKLIESVRPAYGIGFKRDLHFGPVMFALGICQGGDNVPTGEAYEEARNISRWCDMGMVMQVYRQGLLRDVYRWNFLTAPQLDRAMGGKHLEQWIRQDPNRGSLSPVTENVLLWEVEESRIPELRRPLHEAGVLFDWRKYQ